MIRFGPFELHPETGELLKQGIRIRLQPQPFRILCMLLENPGAVVTREELSKRLWPADTFVDFERGVNTAVNRLRLALGDSAEQPRYIETLSRTGYRFIAPVLPITLATAESKVIARPRPRRSWLLVAAACSAAVIAAIAHFWTPTLAHSVRFRQVTFGRGRVSSARFTPDSQGIVYVAQWNAEPTRFFQVSLTNPSARPLGFEGQSLAAVSKTGEFALLFGSGTMNIAGATLSRVAINGGPSEQVDQNIFTADWSPDGRRFAVARVVAGAQQLEFPIGHVLYRTPGWLSNVRIAPSEDAIGFIDHPVRHDDAGAIKTVDLRGHARTLSQGWASAAGLAWRNAQEIWFTATRDGAPRALWAVNLRGELRGIGQAPGILTLDDIAPDGRVLFTLQSRRLELAGRMPADPAERDLSLTDWSRVKQLSPDGSLLLFDESGEGAGSRSVAYIRRIPSGEVVRLGDGVAQGLSADASAALLLAENRRQLTMVPVKGGAGRDLPPSGLEYQWARPFPAGDRLLVLGNYRGQPLRLYIQTIVSGRASPLTPPLMVRDVAISPDGDEVALLTPEGKLTLYPTGGGEPRVIPSNEPLAPIRWSRDGLSLFVQHLRSRVSSSAEVSELQPQTGKTKLWKRLVPSDPIGVNAITGVTIAGDEQSYAYSYRRVLSELYVAEGWK
jgi:DNA-binding winged helix-turn-helix (wHTH) protein